MIDSSFRRRDSRLPKVRLALCAALLTLAAGGCATDPATTAVPTPASMPPDVIPSGRNVVGSINRATDSELVLNVYGGPPPLVFVIRPQDRPNIDVAGLAALAGLSDRVRVFYESTNGKDYALRAEVIRY